MNPAWNTMGVFECPMVALRRPGCTHRADNDWKHEERGKVRQIDKKTNFSPSGVLITIKEGKDTFPRGGSLFGSTGGWSRNRFRVGGRLPL